MFLARRLYSKPKNDTFSLADALGLLSPSRHAKTVSGYKPSLLQNLQKGSVVEQFKELDQGLAAEYPVPSVNHKELFDSLVVDLQAVNALLPKGPPQKSLIGHIKSLEDEEELLELLKLSYYENKLSLQLFSKFLLNKNLRTLSRLPFDVRNLDKVVFEKNGWTNTNFIELKILLLKKYHDLKAPLSIVKILKESFEAEFMPLIKSHALSPFYERIVWKFYFDFMEQSLAKMVYRMNHMRHSFLIWEASAQDTVLMSEVISKQHEFNSLQKLFVELASWIKNPSLMGQTETKIKPTEYSKFLSSLKSVSAKFKLYDVKPSDDVVTRAMAYSLIHKLEACVHTHYPNWKNDAFLKPYMEKLQKTRVHMIQQGHEEAKAGSLAHNIRYV